MAVLTMSWILADQRIYPKDCQSSLRSKISIAIAKKRQELDKCEQLCPFYILIQHI